MILPTWNRLCRTCCLGERKIFLNNYDGATAILARYIEQRTAVHLHKTQAMINMPKLYYQMSNPSDIHSLVKFFRKRIRVHVWIRDLMK